ncbi:MAG: PP2C family protein-serine/threonine phosphatase, partial [Flavobacteriales bacterium]
SLRESGSDYARDGMDIAFCCLDKKNMTLQYAGAYNPLYLINPGRKAWPKMGRKFEDDMPGVEIRADSIVIGLETGAFTNHEIALEKGDRIYLFSDGFADQFGGPKGKKFKYKQFKKLLCSINQKPMAAQQQILDTSFNSWRGELKQLDDVCVLGVEV